MTNDELKKILENHKHWLNEDCKEWRIMKANLSCADMRNVDLCNADLRNAVMYSANLKWAYLCDADIRHADLRGSDLCDSNLRGANLRNSDLCFADLSNANLHLADLSYADLRMANLDGVILHDTNLYGADLRGAKNVPFIPYVCPDFGAFIGFKKARGYIIVLEIPEYAKRSSATSRKCRCDKAKVLEIQNLDGTKSDLTEISSYRDPQFIYRIGEVVSVDDFDKDRWNECSTGIHFFINRQEAVDYIY